jgi:uncharacterized YigZ family protein
LLKYRTVAGAGFSEVTIEKSRFIGHIISADSREVAEHFFAEIRKEHREARHNVPALVIGDKKQMQWASDDGEPQGTAGAPILQMIISEDITNTAIMVTRYFGGIKLGTGGLVRAYTQTAKAALADAGTAAVREATEMRIRITYPYLERLKFLCEKSGYTLNEITYSNDISAIVSAASEQEEDLKIAILGLSNGTAEFLSTIHKDVRFIPNAT